MNILGIGVDIEQIGRFKVLDQKNNKLFLEHAFTAVELAYCFSKANPAEHLAARYAAKEALIKALSSVTDQLVSYNEVEIIHNERGVPISRLVHPGLKMFKTQVSLSHSGEMAIAFALIWSS